MRAIYVVARAGDADGFVHLDRERRWLLDDQTAEIGHNIGCVDDHTCRGEGRKSIQSLPSLWPPRLGEIVRGKRLSNIRPDLRTGAGTA